MFRIVQQMISCLVFFMALTLFSSAPANAETGIEMLTYYIDLVISDNIESAQQYFTPESQRRAGRYGIEYIDVPLKIDCASPLVRYPEIAHNLSPRPFSGETTLAFDNYTRFKFIARVGDESLDKYYYVYRSGDYNWLMFAQDYFAIGWDTVKTKYFSVIYNSEIEKYINPIVLDAADRFVERVAKQLDIPKSDLKLLEKEKIAYFYCQSDNMVRDITGHFVKGTYDLPSDDLISAFFPHYHEITHFLVNFKLRRQHLYTMPLLREGVAVYYGGRWGKSSTSILSMGGYIYREGVVDLDSILTMSGFENSSGSDLAYPLAGLFTAYLFDALGNDGYFEAYRRLSGPFDSLYNMSVTDVENIFVSALGKTSWDEVRTDFKTFLTNWLDNHAGLYPGVVDKGKKLVETDRLLITESDGWISFTATSPDSLPPEGNLLFGSQKKLAGLYSLLYETQYNVDTAMPGYRFAVRFDRNEVGVYDYVTSHLLAKYIWGISPSKEYYDEPTNTVRFRFPRELVDSKGPNKDDYELLEK